MEKEAVIDWIKAGYVFKFRCEVFCRTPDEREFPFGTTRNQHAVQFYVNNVAQGDGIFAQVKPSPPGAIYTSAPLVKNTPIQLPEDWPPVALCLSSHLIAPSARPPLHHYVFQLG